MKLFSKFKRHDPKHMENEQKVVLEKEEKAENNGLLRTYLISLFSLLLCCTMFLSTTYAWFSSSVENSGNEIYVGMLAVDMVDKDGKSLTDAQAQPLFTANDLKWEPGATHYESLTVVNNGDLSFNYRLTLSVGTNTVLENLELIGKHIRVYVMNGDTAATPGSFAEIKENWTYIGKLNHVMKNSASLVSGMYNCPAAPVKGEKVTTVTIALHMDEATNDVNIMGKRIQDISIKLVASQRPYEEDVFGPDYDGTPWDGSAADTSWLNENNGTEADPYQLDSSADLAGLASLVNGTGSLTRAAGNSFDGKYFELTHDIYLNDQLWTPIGVGGLYNFEGNFNGNGHTIYGLRVEQEIGDHSGGLFGVMRGTVENLYIDGATVSNVIDDSNSTGPNAADGTGVVAGSMHNGGIIRNVHVKNATVTGNHFVGGIVGFMDGIVEYCTVTDSSVVGIPNEVSANTYDNGDKVGGVVGHINGNGNSGFNSGVNLVHANAVSNVMVKAYRDVGGIVGAASQAANQVINNDVDNILIVVDQKTNYYGDKTPNANTIIGRRVQPEMEVDPSNTSDRVQIEDGVSVQNVTELNEALTDGGFIALTEDLVLEENTIITVPTDGTAELNLNGHTIAVKGTEEKATYAIHNKGVLIIDDYTGNGTVELTDAVVSAGNTYATNAILNSGTLIVNGGIIRNNLSGASYAIDNSPGGTTTINGGTIINTKGTAIRAYSGSKDSSSTLIINGGTIQGTYAVRVQNLSKTVPSKIDVTINGGTLIADGDGSYRMALYSYCHDGTNVNITLNGGTYNGDVAVGGGNKAAPENVTIVKENCTFNGDVYSYNTTVGELIPSND